MSKYEDDFRPDGKRWACPYCGKGIEGLLEMGIHLESHKKATHIELNGYTKLGDPSDDESSEKAYGKPHSGGM